MSDIVERLRGPIAEAVQKLVNGCFRNGNSPTFHIPAQETDPDLLAFKGIQEAADTIARLNTEVDTLKSAVDWITADYTVCCTDRNRLTAEAERLRAALIDVTASLEAAVSLLHRGGRKAAASDLIFKMMLEDYGRSLLRARAALSPPTITQESNDDPR